MRGAGLCAPPSGEPDKACSNSSSTLHLILPGQFICHSVAVRGREGPAPKPLLFVEVTDSVAVKPHSRRVLHTVGVSGSSPLAPTCCVSVHRARQDVSAHRAHGSEEILAAAVRCNRTEAPSVRSKISSRSGAACTRRAEAKRRRRRHGALHGA